MKTEPTPLDKEREKQLTVTQELQAMYDKVRLTLSDDVKTIAVHEAAKEAFKILFVYFHGLGLREKIDVTMEQDGFKYQLLFKAVREESNTQQPVSKPTEEEGQKELTDAMFCEMYSSYHGEVIDNIRQLASANFNGKELKDFISHCLTFTRKQQ